MEEDLLDIRKQQPTQRTYVICHMMTSLNARTTGSYMDSRWADPGHHFYDDLQDRLEVNGWLNGRSTTEEAFTNGKVPRHVPVTAPIPRHDHIARPDARYFFVSLDPRGQLGWESAVLEQAGRPPAHIIEVLLETVSDEYLALLGELGISYIFAGTHELDIPLALEKLVALFGIHRLALEGGAVTNASFLAAGMIDELSFLMVPAIDDDHDSLTIFENADSGSASGAKGFRLVDIEVLEGDAVWLRYIAEASA